MDLMLRKVFLRLNLVVADADLKDQAKERGAKCNKK